MRAFAQKPKTTRQTEPARTTKPSRTLSGESRAVRSILQLQRTIGNQAAQRILQSNSEELQARSVTLSSSRFSHNFSRIPIQAQPTVNTPGDAYEQEADRVAEQVMHTSEPRVQRACKCGGRCSKCQPEQSDHKHDSLQAQQVGSTNSAQTTVQPVVQEAVASPGQPLDPAARDFMEPRFGHDFSSVRIHSDGQAAEAARSVNALAYTMGTDVVFGQGQYQPRTYSGRKLLAHELTHVVQQSAGITPSLQRQAPAPACADPGESRTLDLQPVFLRTDPADAAPTGTTWTPRFNEANQIWGKLGVTFNELSPVTLDTPLKTAGATRAERDSIRALRSGAGVEVFMVDNDIASQGGATTIAGCGASGKVLVADRGTSTTILAHELGHTMGLGHNGTNSDPGTVMDTSGSHSTDNPRRNTMVNYGFITCPAPSGSTCLNPDV